MIWFKEVADTVDIEEVLVAISKRDVDAGKPGMIVVKSSAAKIQFNSLLKRVAEGETVQITRQGIPIAQLVPMETGKLDPVDVVRDLRALRRGLKLGNLKIRDLIDEGRRR